MLSIVFLAKPGIFNRKGFWAVTPKIKSGLLANLVNAFQVALAGSRLEKPGVVTQRGGKTNHVPTFNDPKVSGTKVPHRHCHASGCYALEGLPPHHGKGFRRGLPPVPKAFGRRGGERQRSEDGGPRDAEEVARGGGGGGWTRMCVCVCAFFFFVRIVTFLAWFQGKPKENHRFGGPAILTYPAKKNTMSRRNS